MSVKRCIGLTLYSGPATSEAGQRRLRMEQWLQTIDPGKALAAYDPRQYQVVVKPEDLVPLSPLVRIDLTAVPLGECAAIGGRQGDAVPRGDRPDRQRGRGS